MSYVLEHTILGLWWEKSFEPAGLSYSQMPTMSVCVFNFLDITRYLTFTFWWIRCLLSQQAQAHPKLCCRSDALCVCQKILWSFFHLTANVTWGQERRRGRWASRSSWKHTARTLQTRVTQNLAVPFPLDHFPLKSGHCALHVKVDPVFWSRVLPFSEFFWRK